MKVLFYNHTGQVSGAERMLLLLLARLNRDRFHCTVICPADGQLTQACRQLAVQVSNIELLEARFTWRPDRLIKYLFSFCAVIVKLRALIRANNPDLVHANTIRAGLVATTATLGLRVNVLWHLHDLLPPHPLSTLIRWYAALTKRTHLLAVSQAVAQRFRGAWLPALRIGAPAHVIHNGIELERFQPAVPASHQFRLELGLDAASFVIGIVGQITPRKGQLELLRAFAAMAQQLPQAVLVIVGAPLFNQDHQYLQALKSAAASLQIAHRVYFTGPRSEIPAVMRAFDLLVLNSKVEPFGLVILEAMACGTPVLATRVDGVPEIITHQQNGWLVPAGDEQRLTAGLIALAQDEPLRARLAEAALCDTVPRFSAASYLRSVESYYQQISTASYVGGRQKLLAGN